MTEKNKIYNYIMLQYMNEGLLWAFFFTNQFRLIYIIIYLLFQNTQSRNKSDLLLEKVQLKRH